MDDFVRLPVVSPLAIWKGKEKIKSLVVVDDRLARWPEALMKRLSTAARRPKALSSQTSFSTRELKENAFRRFA